MSNNDQSNKPTLEQPKPKQFDVKVEFMIPTTITYRVTALTEQDALKEADKVSARKVAMQQNLNRKIKLKATVYGAHSSMIKLSKIYRSL